MAMKSLVGPSDPVVFPDSSVETTTKPLVLAEGTLQALKWIALVVMVFDHVNKYAFRETLPYIFEIGRSVLPIFAFVLAYNLARPRAQSSGAHRRTMLRLSIAGLISIPIVTELNTPLVSKWPWWPLNVLFMFLLAIAVPLLWGKGGRAWRLLAILTFLVGGALVEYFWFGVVCCWASFAFIRRPSAVTFAFWALAVLLLTIVNGNLWALASVPVLLLATKVSLAMPRSKWVFYVFYPAHLLVIWLLFGVLGLHGAAAL